MNHVARTFFLLMAVLAVKDLVVYAGEATSTYIVQLQQPEIAFTSMIDRLSWYASFAGAGKPLMYSYKNVITGFAARLTEADVVAMREVPGFVAVYPDVVLSLHTSYSSQFLGLNPAKGLWPATGFGKGVIIGVLDTGVWPESPSFADLGMPPPPAKWKGICETAPDFNASNCNNKLIGARVFRAGDSNPTPRDVQGHGTHTSSTAAGNRVSNANLFGYAHGTASGMASSAHVAIYKVCGENGCLASDILAGMDQAIADGVDVLSLSLGAGSGVPLFKDPIAVGAFTAIEKGIFVSCSAGNDGPAHSTISNGAPWIMTVGASSMDRNFIATVRLSNGIVLYGESLYPSKGPTKLLPLIHGNLCLNGSLNPNDVAGKMVVCQRGGSGRMMKGDVVREAGGAGMILTADLASGEEIIAEPHVLPATFVGYSAGDTIKTYINLAKTPTAAINFQGTVFGTVDAPAVATFSSRGPSAADPEFVKPDVIAPGVSVLAAWPSDISPSELPDDHRRVMFNIKSGTSMSCPHVSGLAALLKAVHPDWSPAAIKSALMTTADVVDKKGVPILDSTTNMTADVFATGSGHVNPEKAANPGLIYDLSASDYIAYLCGLNYTASQIRAILKKDVTCPTDRESTLSGNLNYPSFSARFQNTTAPTCTTFKRTVTNVGAAKSTYIASIRAPPGVQVSVNPTILSFAQVMEKKSYNITFTVPTPRAQSHPFSQGSLTWISISNSNSTSTLNYKVRSPISITWYQ